MSLIDFILNVVGLLLWLNWRAVPLTSLAPPGTSIATTLKPAGPPRSRSFYLVALIALLLLRACVYWQIGPPLYWIPRISLGPTVLSFRSDFFGRILLFSALSFAATLAVFYLWLLFLSWINANVSDADAGQRLVRQHLGALERLPRWLKLFLPLAAMTLLWCLLNPFFARVGLAPHPPAILSWRQLGQAAVIGLAVYPALKFLLVAILILYLLNSYVYLGELPFWNFVNVTARGLLRPLRSLPLQVGRFDFAPVLAAGIVLLAAEFSQRGLTRLYQHLF